ncbi:MAG: hypothetical protein RBS37_12545 [Bacteroidales bacterium]|jgi:hypothetical protein|nr:hypothetical protein [Bacteroidales bacterium]
MKRTTIYLFILLSVFAAIPNAIAQEEGITEKRLILSARVRIIPQGLEMSFEHAVSQKFSLRTSLGYDFRQKGDYTYNNEEVVMSMLSNSRVYPYGFTVGPYLKLKYSNYNYSYPDTEAMLDAYTRLYFFGAGVATEYRQKIGSRFMVSPFVRFGVNRVLIRKEYGPAEPFFTDSFETDMCLGAAVSFVF